ncbi:MAG: FimB/Mfa2 family fimbrial subunit, partial [Prevotella sp.]|nr:FimB/Mfa2 family fimbrial subunit [Prevotella sp.]
MMEQNRLSHSARTAILLAILAMLAACEKSIIDEDLQSPNALLQVTTRAGGGDEATVAYPVQVYVFQGDECRAVQTIGDEGQTLNIALVEGTYSVYAIGGASSTDYSLPTKDDATTTTALTLKDGKALTDLMAATATATLVDGGTNTVTLGLARKVMMIQNIEIKKIPTAATAVSVTIAPLWQNITVGANYAGTTGSSTITLAKQSDGRTWKLPSPSGEGQGVRLLPP